MSIGVAREEIDRECEQLLECWRSLLRNETWRNHLEGKVATYFAAMQSRDDRKQKYKIRAIHDKLGYEAKEDGLCRGAIFRTEKFIKTTNRSGTKSKGQTVHIEHTVPIAELDRQLRSRFYGRSAEGVEFLLNFSVCSAFNITEKSIAVPRGYNSKTDAFNAGHVDQSKPFRRYKPLFESGAVIWNVFDKVPVNPDSFDFDEHGDVVHRLIGHCS